MTPAPETPPPTLTTRLPAGPEAAAGADPPSGSDDLSSKRRRLAALELEAEEVGRPLVAASFRRIGILTEVWECLAESSPAEAREVAAFCAEALERLVELGAEAEAEGEPERVLDESTARWGEYLRLIDPEAGTEPFPPELESAQCDDAPSAIDPGTLLRMLTGEEAPEAPAASAGAGTDPERKGPESIGEGEAPTEPCTLERSAGASPSLFSALRPRRLCGAFDAPARGPEGRGVEDSAPATPGPQCEKIDHAHAGPPAPALEVPPSPVTLVIDPELRETFLVEASDLFERIETLVLGLSRGQCHSRTLDEIGRRLHTLKGAAGSVGLVQLATLVHAVEERLEGVGPDVPGDLIDLLHKVLHYLEGVFIALRRGAAASPIEPSPATGLETAGPEPVEPGRALERGEKPASEPVPGPVEADGPGEGPVRISSERIDGLMDIVSDLIMRRGSWVAQTETLKGFSSQVRTARNRLTATIDRLRDLRSDHDFATTRGRAGLIPPDGQNERPDLFRRLIEQSEDLLVLTERAQTAAKPLSDSSDALA
jgi:HPt (histidine-containing phosphotransfer) domain-containing protein